MPGYQLLQSFQILVIVPKPQKFDILFINQLIKQGDLFIDYVALNAGSIGILKFYIPFCQNQFDFETFINEILSLILRPDFNM
jgi:hypothetical protein